MPPASRTQPPEKAKKEGPFLFASPEGEIILRTLNSELKEPYSHQDKIAKAFRNYLNPGVKWASRTLVMKGPVVKKIADSHPINRRAANYLDCRSQYMDISVTEALEAGIKQVVILGAGYDTKAYRLRPGPDVTFYEVDTPEMIEAKKRMLKKTVRKKLRDNAVLVATDVTQGGLAAALGQTSFDPSRPAVFVLEGMLTSITRDTANRILSSVSSVAASGSRVFFDFLHEDAYCGLKKYTGYPEAIKELAAAGRPIRNAWDDSASCLKMALTSLNPPLDFKRRTGPRTILERFKPHINLSHLVTFAQERADAPTLVFFSFAEAFKP